MKDLIIVDGYNFIFKYHKARKISNEKLSYIRDKLIHELVQYRNYTSTNIIVVFDGRNIENIEGIKQNIDKIRVIYSGSGGTADAAIEKLIYNKKGYDRIFVVTSDYVQQKVVFRDNIYRKSIREFAIELEKSKRELKKKIEKNKSDAERTFYTLEKRLNSKSKDKLLKIIK